MHIILCKDAHFFVHFESNLQFLWRNEYQKWDLKMIGGKRRDKYNLYIFMYNLVFLVKSVLQCIPRISVALVLFQLTLSMIAPTYCFSKVLPQYYIPSPLNFS